MTCPAHRAPHRPKPLFIADWMDVAFVHFRVDPAALEPLVPFALDRFEGEAYVSLVAFTQLRLRPRLGGRLTEWLSAPLAQHAFLNVRTYVRHDGTSAIFFLDEWIPNRLATWIGPRTYGLPYRLGMLRYERLRRRVNARGRALQIDIAPPPPPDAFSPCAAGSLDAFLLERYTAFTHRDNLTRRFDVDHIPWPQARVTARLTESSLLELSGDWWRSARLAGAHYSPGVRDVTMSAPTARCARTRPRSTSRWPTA